MLRCFGIQKNMMSRMFLFISVALVLSFVSLTYAKEYGEWGVPVNAEEIEGTSEDVNTEFNDGCPIQSPDSLSLYIATNRPGGLGGQDIWVAHRASKDGPWGAPEHLPEPVNSTADDFCPTPVRGHGLFFVSRRVIAESCGGADIYFTRFKNDEWEEPQNLGCVINSSADEFSPSYFEDEGDHAILYFSSDRPGGLGGHDIYFCIDFGPAQPAAHLNTESDDSRPNVRHDGREIVFDSNRLPTLGGPDIWSASRESTEDDWSEPVHLITISSNLSDTRASLSRNGTTLVFGSNRAGSEGMADVYVTTRERSRGKEK